MSLFRSKGIIIPTEKLNLLEGTIEFGFQTSDWDNNKLGVFFDESVKQGRIALIKDQHNYLRFIHESPDSGKRDAFTYVGDLVKSKRHHIAITWSHGDLCIYVDGELKDSTKKHGTSRSKLIHYSELAKKVIEKFKLNERNIVATIMEPLKSQSFGNISISTKSFASSIYLVSYIYDGENLEGKHISVGIAYEIFLDLPNPIGIPLKDQEPANLLETFMNEFGLDVYFEGQGNVKILIDPSSKLFFSGVLDEEKYLKWLNKH